MKHSRSFYPEVTVKGALASFEVLSTDRFGSKTSAVQRWANARVDTEGASFPAGQPLVLRGTGPPPALAQDPDQKNTRPLPCWRPPEHSPPRAWATGPRQCSMERPHGQIAVARNTS